MDVATAFFIGAGVGFAFGVFTIALLRFSAAMDETAFNPPLPHIQEQKHVDR